MYDRVQTAECIIVMQGLQSSKGCRTPNERIRFLPGAFLSPQHPEHARLGPLSVGSSLMSARPNCVNHRRRKATFVACL